MANRPRHNVGVWAPGFPKEVLLDGYVVPTDELIVQAAAFLDTMPATERVSPAELAAGIGIHESRAAQILEQLSVLGHAGAVQADGQRPIFDPDGPTIALERQPS